MSDPFRLTRPVADVLAVAFLGAAVLAAAVTLPMSRGSGARAAEPEAATPTAVEQARLGAARRALGDGDPAKAVAALEQAGPPAAADAPDSGFQRLFYLGLAHQELARKGGPNAAVSLQKSLDLYQQALKLKPGSPALLNNLAQVLADLNRLPEAAALLERALATPDRRQAFYTVNYGNVLVQLGKERDALRFCRAAAFGPPPDARAHSWVVRFHARRDLPGLAGYLREMLDRGGVVLVQESLIDLFDRTERPSRAAIPQPVEMELLAVLASCLSSQAYDPAEFGKTPAAAGLRKLAGQGGFAAERARELLALHESDRQLSADQFHWWVDPGEWGLGGDPTEAASKLALTPGDALNALVRALGRRHQSAGRADVAERYFRLATRLVPGFTDPDAFVDLLDLYLEGDKKSQVDALAREFEAPLFQGKASSIRKREHDRTYRYHRALGVLYVHLQRWGDRNTVASATFQLETALQDALVFRREQTDRGDAGARAAGRRREPFAVDPRLGDMLVRCYAAAGQPEVGWDRAGRFINDFLAAGDVASAAALIEPMAKAAPPAGARPAFDRVRNDVQVAQSQHQIRPAYAWAVQAPPSQWLFSSTLEGTGGNLVLADTGPRTSRRISDAEARQVGQWVRGLLHQRPQGDGKVAYTLMPSGGPQGVVQVSFDGRYGQVTLAGQEERPLKFFVSGDTRQLPRFQSLAPPDASKTNAPRGDSTPGR